MIDIRNAQPDEIEALARVAGDDDEFAGRLRSMLGNGTTKLEWVFVALADGEPIARVAFGLDEPPAQAPSELYLFGLALDWQRPGAREAGLAMLRHALPLAAALGPPIDARVNREIHADFEPRRALLEEAGLSIFQEKAGHFWQASASPPPARPDRLRFRSLREIGRDAFLAVLARGPAETLDRNDRYYYALTGPRGWAEVMMGYLQPGDEDLWKVGYDPKAGDAVGYFMLSAFDEEGTATINHIGVVPEQRGRGYIDDLLAEATADARQRGFESILSDVDVLNLPMRAAMERAGHRSGVRPWYVWHYRLPAA